MKQQQSRTKPQERLWWLIWSSTSFRQATAFPWWRFQRTKPCPHSFSNFSWWNPHSRVETCCNCRQFSESCVSSKHLMLLRALWVLCRAWVRGVILHPFPEQSRKIDQIACKSSPNPQLLIGHSTKQISKNRWNNHWYSENPSVFWMLTPIECCISISMPPLHYQRRLHLIPRIYVLPRARYHLDNATRPLAKQTFLPTLWLFITVDAWDLPNAARRSIDWWSW